MTDTLNAAPTRCPTCNGDGTAVPFDGNCPSAWVHGFVRSPACPANPSGVVGSAPVTENTVVVHGDNLILQNPDGSTTARPMRIAENGNV